MLLALLVGVEVEVVVPPPPAVAAERGVLSGVVAVWSEFGSGPRDCGVVGTRNFAANDDAKGGGVETLALALDIDIDIDTEAEDCCACGDGALPLAAAAVSCSV